MSENYIFKKEVDWSLLREGLTIKIENQVAFAASAGRYLQKGEKKNINIVLNGKTYVAKLTNVNFDKKYERHADVLQIRYSPNSDLAVMLRTLFASSYEYIKAKREVRSKDDRSYIKVPEDKKEYFALYTTEYDDTYLAEVITCYDMDRVRQAFVGQDERVAEESFGYDATDDGATIEQKESIRKVRKLNRKIGENLKLIYEYKCQFCGRVIGEEYGSQIADAHHIDYFVKSLNNDASNQLIVCPNHHRIIHAEDPIFDRLNLQYIYDNGYRDKIVINKHL